MKVSPLVGQTSDQPVDCSVEKLENKQVVDSVASRVAMMAGRMDEV